MRLPRAEARREVKIKGVYSRFILVGQKPGSLRTTVKNLARWTLTGMLIPIRAHSMPLTAWSGFGVFTIGVSICVVIRLSWFCQVPCPKDSNSTDTHALFVLSGRSWVLATDVQTGIKTLVGTMNKTELARKIQALTGLDNEEKSTLLELI